MSYPEPDVAQTTPGLRAIVHLVSFCASTKLGPNGWHVSSDRREGASGGCGSRATRRSTRRSSGSSSTSLPRRKIRAGTGLLQAREALAGDDAGGPDHGGGRGVSRAAYEVRLGGHEVRTIRRPPPPRGRSRGRSPPPFASCSNPSVVAPGLRSAPMSSCGASTGRWAPSGQAGRPVAVRDPAPHAEGSAGGPKLITPPSALPL
jgi:hypothetical protein